jgi:hypothetical protein
MKEKMEAKDQRKRNDATTRTTQTDKRFWKMISVSLPNFIISHPVGKFFMLPMSPWRELFSQSHWSNQKFE